MYRHFYICDCYGMRPNAAPPNPPWHHHNDNTNSDALCSSYGASSLTYTTETSSNSDITTAFTLLAQQTFKLAQSTHRLVLGFVHDELLLVASRAPSLLLPDHPTTDTAHSSAAHVSSQLQCFVFASRVLFYREISA
eukprot:11546929-Ditylum_brightwellii.AAC.1